jgi:hypothetical protein
VDFFIHLILDESIHYCGRLVKRSGKGAFEGVFGKAGALERTCKGMQRRAAA